MTASSFIVTSKLRPRLWWPLFLVALLATSLCANCDSSYDPGRSRGLIQSALEAQRAGRHEEAKKLVAGHEAHPLYPYYLYFDIRRRLHRLPEAEVSQFLTGYDESYLADKLRIEWLKRLATRQRWNSYLTYYRPQSDVTMRCLQIKARIREGHSEGVVADAKALWLVGKSQPEECDPAFEALYASVELTNDLVWQRIWLAANNGKFSLAQYLAKKLSTPQWRHRATLLTRAHHNPQALLKAKDTDLNDPQVREILTYAIKRLTRVNVNQAIKQWPTLRRELPLDERQSAEVKRAIAVRAAAKDHDQSISLLNAVPYSHVDEKVERYRLRDGIAKRAWQSLIDWTRHDPQSDVSKLRWRYWRAHALKELGRGEQAELILEELAAQRDYYGFVAADMLGKDYDFNFVPIAATDAEIAEVSAIPGMRRAGELYQLDMKFWARREWQHEVKKMSQREQEIAAALAAQWGWYDRAIFALGSAQSYDDLELRFPLMYVDQVLNFATARKLKPARMLAIIRSESAFIPDVRSPAGALGLMQLMPATAREMANQTGIKLPSAKTLYQPAKNIALGSAYLAQMLRRFNDNFAMAAAAYNAGPHRVRQWRSRKACIPLKLWVDTIPFTETRRYVRRAFFYTAVYQWRLGEDIDRLVDQFSPIPPRGKKTCN
ncbi:MAG: transglycosylase SLT domain-containing protein [Pseudomonadota bacterium]